MQPLWTAVARIKTIVLKEYERSQATAEAAAAHARGVDDLGNAPFMSEAGRIWVTNVSSTEMDFRTSFVENMIDDHMIDQVESPDREWRDEMDGPPPPLRIPSEKKKKKEKKPFHVRVNQADWPSVRIDPIPPEDMTDRPGEVRWAVEIYGLAPGTTYTCEFIGTADPTTLWYRLSLTTPQLMTESGTPSSPSDQTYRHAPLANGGDIALNATSGLSTTMHKSLRPSSPVTTLRQSIAAAELKLEEERNAVRKLRKEHKGLIGHLRRELDNLNVRFGGSGSGDDRQRHRLQQISHHIRQAEDDAASFSSQMETLKTVPEEDRSAWKESRTRWEISKEHHSKVQDDLAEHVNKMDRQRSVIRAEALTVRQRRDRVQTRQAKLKDQLHRIDQGREQQPPNENEPKSAGPDGHEERRRSVWQHYTGQLQQLQHKLQETRSNSQQLWSQIRLIEDTYNEQHQLMTAAAAAAMPSTPERSLSSNFPTTQNPHSARFGHALLPSLMASNQGSMTSSSRPATVYHEGRRRSSSMRSNLSGLTEYVDAPTTMMSREMLPSHTLPDFSYPTDIPRIDPVGEAGGSPASAAAAAVGGHDRHWSGSYRSPLSPLPRHHHHPPSYGGINGGNTSPVWQSKP